MTGSNRLLLGFGWPLVMLVALAVTADMPAPVAATGFVADRFLTRALDAGWVRRGRHPRAVGLTSKGRAVLGTWSVALPDRDGR